MSNCKCLLPDVYEHPTVGANGALKQSYVCELCHGAVDEGIARSMLSNKTILREASASEGPVRALLESTEKWLDEMRETLGKGPSWGTTQESSPVRRVAQVQELDELLLKGSGVGFNLPMEDMLDYDLVFDERTGQLLSVQVVNKQGTVTGRHGSDHEQVSNDPKEWKMEYLGEVVPFPDPEDE